MCADECYEEIDNLLSSLNRQMRYQQKVMQETAQKKSDMYSGYDDTQKLLTSSLGAGKVS